MRPSRVGVIAVTCAAILAFGYVLAPAAPPTLQLVTPATATETTEVSP